MASPYTIRSRAHFSSPISNGNMFKSYDITPRPASRRQPTSECNRQQNVAPLKVAQQSTARTNRAKVPMIRKNTSQQEFSALDGYSNSFGQSSVVVEKFRRSEVDLDKSEQNIHCLENEQTLVFAINSSEKEVQPNGDKCLLEEDDSRGRNKDRLQKSWSLCGVPYRKCHSSMEEKVVTVINKIKSGKECHKEIETLIDKTRKVSIKELNNRYFVSGIQLICNLSLDKEYKSIFTPELVQKLSDGLEDLKNRILSELDNTKGFQVKEMLPQEITYEKLQLVRKAYKVLRKKLRSLKREQVQNKALEAADWFLENKVNDLCLFYDELAQC